QRLWGSEHPTPIRRTPRLVGSVTVDLTIPPSAVREEEVTGGRLQLLARLTLDPAGRMVIDLIPHHHVPKLTLQPRTALEKELDGRMFNELALRAYIPQGAVLVVGLYRPWPKPEETAEPELPIAPVPPAEPAKPGAPEPGVPGGPAIPGVPGAPVLGQRVEAAQPTEAAPAPTIAPPPLYNNLGRAFFADLRGRQPVQTIMLATVEPLEPPAPSFAPPPEDEPQ